MPEPENKFLDSAALSRLMMQPLVARFPMEGTVSGQHKSPHRGSSVEFAEYRNYVPGDDLRRLDWRVLGRTDRYYMKEFDAETNLRCYLVLDCSASMRFTGKHQPKLDFARRLAATLAYLVIHQGDAAGILCVGEKAVFELPPRRNPAHLRLLMETLERVEGRGRTGLASALHGLAERIRRRAVVVVLSDCFVETEELLNCFQHLRFQKHDLVVFHILDRMELDFPFDRPIRFVDLETSTSLVTEPAVVRAEYLKQIGTYLELMKNGCHEFKADYRLAMTDQDSEKIIGDFLVERARMAAIGPV